MSFNAAIFDLDGTLLDTLDGITQSLNFTLESRGFPPRTPGEVKAATGYGARHLIRECMPKTAGNALIDSVLEQYRDVLKRLSPGLTKPYDGIPELLAALKKTGIKQAVLSNKPDEAVKELCERFFPGIFNFIGGEIQGQPRKPDARAVTLVLAALGARAENTLLVGDSEVDILTAKNSGVTSVGAAWGFRDRYVLETEGADFIINSPSELLRIIKR